jgi:hypothetical protein
MKEDDLTDWDLGVSFDLHDLSMREIEELFFYFSQLALDYDHDFAVGYYDKETGISEDFGFIEPNGECAGITKILKELKSS